MVIFIYFLSKLWSRLKKWKNINCRPNPKHIFMEQNVSGNFISAIQKVSSFASMCRSLYHYNKLECYGVRRILNKQFPSCGTDRKRFILLNRCMSNLEEVKYGLFQFSILNHFCLLHKWFTSSNPVFWRVPFCRWNLFSKL